MVLMLGILLAPEMEQIIASYLAWKNEKEMVSLLGFLLARKTAIMWDLLLASWMDQKNADRDI
eukprot:9466912-Ditylum_brightwellii.AAC.1